MQGNSESWRRLDRMRAASAGLADRPSAHESTLSSASRVAADDLAAESWPVTAPSGSGGGIAESASGPSGREPVTHSAQRGRHAASDSGEVPAPTTERTEPEHAPVRPWVPDDDAEGPMVGAALDRWVARRTAVADHESSRATGYVVGDPEALGDDDRPIDRTGSAADRSGGDEAADPDDRGPVSAESDRGRRPVSRWRARLRRSLGRGAELWVPEPLRGARVDPGRRGAMALLLVAAVAAAITAVGVWRDRPEARAVATVAAGSVGLVAADPPSSSDPVGSGPVSDPGTSASPAPAPATTIVVSVTGLVARPGVVTIPGDGRVADAIAAAGGLTSGADVTGLNLAAKLTDGASVVVGAAGASVQAAGSDAGAGTGTPGADTGGRVDLNTADADELDTLPGVGPVMAGNIIAWRDTNGRFTSVDQLREISGIGPARYAQLSELVMVS